MRAVILMEADISFFNKLFIGVRIMNMTEKSKVILVESMEDARETEK